VLVLKLFRYIAIALVLSCGVAWVLSTPRPLPEGAFDGLQGDVSKGSSIFWAAGCASCHADPDAAETEKLILSGGYRIESPYGAFIAPNISPGPQGIGGWSVEDLGNALIAGISKSGQHLYPSLPYTAYNKMTFQDVADLHAFLSTLPVSETPSAEHELAFPFTIRRGLGLWKQLNVRSDWYLTDVDNPGLQRGRYLVEALGHCAECHTPRNLTGGLDVERWMQGAPNPSGKGTIPAINSEALGWPEDDIAYYLETGFTPEFDSAGGQMTKVIASLRNLTDADRRAIAAYLVFVP
jgi:mono/diheme cytochrome c family protein